MQSAVCEMLLSSEIALGDMVTKNGELCKMPEICKGTKVFFKMDYGRNALMIYKSLMV